MAITARATATEVAGTLCERAFYTPNGQPIVVSLHLIGWYLAEVGDPGLDSILPAIEAIEKGLTRTNAPKVYKFILDGARGTKDWRQRFHKNTRIGHVIREVIGDAGWTFTRIVEGTNLNGRPRREVNVNKRLTYVLPHSDIDRFPIGREVLVPRTPPTQARRLHRDTNTQAEVYLVRTELIF